MDLGRGRRWPERRKRKATARSVRVEIVWHAALAWSRAGSLT